MSGGITLEEMRNISANVDFSTDIGNVIDIGGMNEVSIGDDMGMNLLMNSGSAAPPKQQQQSSFGPIEITPLDTLEPIQLNIPSGAPGPAEISINRTEQIPTLSNFDNTQTFTGGANQFTMAPPRDLEAERQKKIQLLNKLQRLENKGFRISKRFTQDNSLEEIEGEFNRLVDARNLESSLKFQRQMMMGFVTGAEYLNNKFNPLDLELDGWSESVHENIDDFDEIFEDLYDKYKERGKMPPEVRLVMALAGSGFMFHVSNSFFRQKMPSMDNVLKANPELARQMAAAAAAQAGPGFGNFMSAAMNAGGAGPASSPNSGSGRVQQEIPPTGAFFSASGAVPQAPSSSPQVARKEMSGPKDVDDILKTFEEVRRAEMDSFRSGPGPVANMSVGGAASQQSAVFAAAEIQSVVSDDLQSVADSQFTKGTAATGGRGRKKKPAVGNTFSLNV